MKSNIEYCLVPLAVEQVEWHSKSLSIWMVF